MVSLCPFLSLTEWDVKIRQRQGALQGKTFMGKYGGKWGISPCFCPHWHRKAFGIFDRKCFVQPGFMLLSAYKVWDDSTFLWDSAVRQFILLLVLFFIWIHRMRMDELKLNILHPEFEDVRILDLQVPRPSSPALDLMLDFLNVPWCSDLRALSLLLH